MCHFYVPVDEYIYTNTVVCNTCIGETLYEINEYKRVIFSHKTIKLTIVHKSVHSNEGFS